MSHALRGAFAAAGLAPGDRVAIVSRNVPEYVEILFGCWWAGLIAVPVNAKLHPKELAFILANSGARWAFVDAPGTRRLPAIDDERDRARARDRPRQRRIRGARRSHRRLPQPRRCADDDPAWLFYTSGTTGRPREW